MSINFPDPIDGKFSEDGSKFTLDSDFEYIDEEKDLYVLIPAGFQTDFNSVPRPLWGYFPPWQYLEAGLVHDWLYKAPERFTSKSFKPPLSRQQVDDIHRRILDLKGCRWTKRQIIYAALRAGAWVAWNRYRSNSQ